MSEFAHRVISARSSVSRHGLKATTALGSLIALGIFAAPQAAVAAQECGAGTSGTITCTATGNP